MTNSQMVAPIIALISWTLIMTLWMYATRIPAIFKAKMRMDSHAKRGQQMSELPASVRWKADNYNHLMEQPTLFYAVSICTIFLGIDNGINLVFAWSYVILRIIHSLIQSLGNKIELRFTVFILSNIPLFALTISAILALLSK